jgi:Ca-activated chloride channel family protein
MKKDLERFKDKMTPEEERLVWSKMKDGLRKGKTGRTSWFPRLWVSRVVYAGAAAAVAIVIWQTGLLTPDKIAEQQVGAMRGPVVDKLREADADAADERLRESTEAGRGGEFSEERAGDVAAEEAIEGGPEKSVAESGGEILEAEEIPERGVVKPAPPETRVYDEALGAAVTAETEKKDEEKMPLDREYEGEEGEPYEATKRVTEETARADALGLDTVAAQTVPAQEAETFRAKAYFSAQEEYEKKSKVRDAGHIVGRITDKNGDPVASATVTIDGTRYGAMTDEGGDFEIRNVPAGTYTLVISVADQDEMKLPGIVVEKGKTYDLKTVTYEVEGLKIEESEEYEVGKMYFGQQSPQAADMVVRERRAASPMLEVKRRDKRGGRYPSLTGGSRPVNDQLADDMFFQNYGTNPFIDADEDALSTFGLDVDTGSYTISRRYINEGHLPPPDAVRVEEFVNFFPKDFDPPRRGDFAIHVDGMPSPFAHVKDSRYYLLRVGIRGRVVDDRNRKPAQVVLVIDTSGSMGMGNRLPLLKSAMEVLLDELRHDDEIGIVEFGSQAREVLPLTPIGEGEREIYRAIRSLRDGGSTNAEHGLQLGYQMMRRYERRGYIHRIIFCSDGVANVGNTGWESILESVRRDRDEIQLTTIGFGMGNYNDILMEQLADAGDGQYAYVDNMREAKRVLRQNLTGTLQTIAKDAKAQIEFDPDYVVKYRLLGYENRDIRDEDFRDDTIDAGEIGAGHEVTVLYEVKLQEKLHKGTMATVHLRYEDPESGRVREIDEPVSPRFVRREFDDTPPDFVMDACVAEFAEILRHSYWAKDSELEDVYDLLRDAEDRMTSRADVDELLDLMKKAMRIEDENDDPPKDLWYEEDEE